MTQQPQGPPPGPQPGPPQFPPPAGPSAPQYQHPAGPSAPQYQHPAGPSAPQFPGGPPSSQFQQPAGPPRKGGSKALWIGAGVAALVLILVVAAAGVFAVRAIGQRGADPRPTAVTAPSPSPPAPTTSPAPETEDPQDPEDQDDLPDEITFAAGASLPADLMPGFGTTLINDPEWTADPEDVNLFDGASTYTHNSSGCVLFTYQTLATDIEFGEDDYANSEMVLRSFYDREDIGVPGKYLYDANFKSSKLEVAAIVVGLESGKGQLTTARGFGVSNVALITTFTCPQFDTTAAQFETLALPTMSVMFLPN